jgi:hypothetical protein
MRRRRDALCHAKKDGGVRTLVLSVFGTSWRPETQIKGTVRKSAGVLQIICGSGNVSSEMERKAQRRTFCDSMLMGEDRGATEKDCFCRRQVQGPDF